MFDLWYRTITCYYYYILCIYTCILPLLYQPATCTKGLLSPHPPPTTGNDATMCVRTILYRHPLPLSSPRSTNAAPKQTVIILSTTPSSTSLLSVQHHDLLRTPVTHCSLSFLSTELVCFSITVWKGRYSRLFD